MSIIKNFQVVKQSIGAACCAAVLSGVDPALCTTIQCDSVLTAFASTDNSQIKISVLRDIMSGAISCDNQTPPNLVRAALSDERPSVVEEGIFWAGNSKYSELAPQLADLFRSAAQKYPGSQTRIQDRIIVALGSIEGKETQSLFKEILERGNADPRTRTVLESISDATGLALLTTITAFSEKIRTILSTMPNTPETSYKYSQYRNLLSMAQAIITKNSSR